MKNTIKLGKLAGVTVELNWTVLVIAALVTLSVAGGILPAAAPGYRQPSTLWAEWRQLWHCWPASLFTNWDMPSWRNATE